MHKPHPGHVVLCVYEAGALPTVLGVFSRVLEMGSHYVAQDTLKMILLTQPFWDRASKTLYHACLYAFETGSHVLQAGPELTEDGLNSAPPASQC